MTENNNVKSSHFSCVCTKVYLFTFGNCCLAFLIYLATLLVCLYPHCSSWHQLYDLSVQSSLDIVSNAYNYNIGLSMAQAMSYEKNEPESSNNKVNTKHAEPNFTLLMDDDSDDNNSDGDLNNHRLKYSIGGVNHASRHPGKVASDSHVMNGVATTCQQAIQQCAQHVMKNGGVCTAMYTTCDEKNQNVFRVNNAVPIGNGNQGQTPNGRFHLSNSRIVFDEQDKGLLIPDYILQKYGDSSIHDVLYYTAQHYSNQNYMTNNKFTGIYFGTPESNAEFPYTFSMLLSETQMKKEFADELIYCRQSTKPYLTSFSPVVGFHVLCFHHYPLFKQSLVVAYLHGYSKPIIGQVKYKNRKTCKVRNIREHFNNMYHPFADPKRNPKGYFESGDYGTASHSGDGNYNYNYDLPVHEQDLPNGTYYFTNDCNYSYTPETTNPKYLLITWKTVKELRRHLQNHLIADVASHDQWTIGGQSIHAAFLPKNQQQPNTNTNTNTANGNVNQNGNANANVGDNRNNHDNNHGPSYQPTPPPSTENTNKHCPPSKNAQASAPTISPTYFSDEQEHSPDENNSVSNSQFHEGESNNAPKPNAANHDKQNKTSNCLTCKKNNKNKNKNNKSKNKMHKSYKTHKKNMNSKYFEDGIHAFSQYHKNAFQIFTPFGATLSWETEVASIPPIMFLYEGGRWIWPGINKHHTIELSIGPTITLKTLNMRPLIFEVTGLISDAELDYLQNCSEPYLKRSEVGLNVGKKISDSRTCSSAWLFAKNDMVINSFKKRVSKLLLTPKSHLEDMEILKYTAGQRFDIHFDAFQTYDSASVESQILLHGGFKNRIATVFYYLNDFSQMEGGSTVFPRSDFTHNLQQKNNVKVNINNINIQNIKPNPNPNPADIHLNNINGNGNGNAMNHHTININAINHQVLQGNFERVSIVQTEKDKVKEKEKQKQKIFEKQRFLKQNSKSTQSERDMFDRGCKGRGFKLLPQKGKVVLWYNMDSAGNLDPLALHGGCAVNKGVKWAGNQWIWNRPFN